MGGRSNEQQQSQTHPKYRRQRRLRLANQAFVEIHGLRHYLGSYDSPSSRQIYHRLLAETLTGNQLAMARDEITVTEVSARFVV